MFKLRYINQRMKNKTKNIRERIQEAPKSIDLLSQVAKISQVFDKLQEEYARAKHQELVEKLVKFMDNETQIEEAMTKEQETKIEELVASQQQDVGIQTKEEIPPKNINHETWT